MTPEEIQAIIANTAALKARQQHADTAEDLARLPSLKLADLDRTNKTIPIAVSDLAGGTLLYHDLFTNGILYMNLGFNLGAVPQELLPYVPFFGHALQEMGTTSEDYVKFSQRIDRKTGGVWNSTYLSEVRGQESPGGALLRLQQGDRCPGAGSARHPARHVADREARRPRSLPPDCAEEQGARREASLVPSGHAYVRDRLRAGLTTAGWADEQMDGIEGLFFIRRLAEQVEQDWPSVLAKLDAVRQALVSRGGMLVNVTLDAENWATVEPQVDRASCSRCRRPQTAPSPGRLPCQRTTKGCRSRRRSTMWARAPASTAWATHYHGSIHVINNFVRTGWLWDKVRAEGGAYGAFVSFGKQSGVYSFISYRDPNLENTLKVYDQTADLLRSIELSDDELTKNIIGAIGDVDSYQLPDAKGYTSMVRYLVGETRRKPPADARRDPVDDGGRFPQVRRRPGRAERQARVVVLGSAGALSAANAQNGRQLKITKVM